MSLSCRVITTWSKPSPCRVEGWPSKKVEALANLVWPVMEDAGMTTSEWQIVGAESLVSQSFPVGFMRWTPAGVGPKFSEWLDFWGNLTADDVLGNAARERFKIDNFKVPLSQAKPSAPPITDATFENRETFSYNSFLFDACYSFVIAINALLNSGRSIAEIKQEVLLDQLKITQFEGISGSVAGHWPILILLNKGGWKCFMPTKF